MTQFHGSSNDPSKTVAAECPRCHQGISVPVPRPEKGDFFVCSVCRQHTRWKDMVLLSRAEAQHRMQQASIQYHFAAAQGR